MLDVIELAQALIQRPSITPNDAGCQRLIQQHLRDMRFEITQLPFAEVSNFWARHGQHQPLLVFAGHTDVVPTGPENQWQYPPFAGAIVDEKLYGRGAADMKSAIAAFMVACQRFIKQNPSYRGSIGFLITSDEEGPSIHGTKPVVEYLQKNNIAMDWCLVGEPSSSKQLGDTIKIGRRGSLNGVLKIKGKQGHIAYPHLANNPIPKTMMLLDALCQLSWDQGNQDFPPTQFQISNIHAGTGANNVIPGEVIVEFNFRYSPESTAEQLKQQVITTIENFQVSYELNWQLSGEPFYTAQSPLINACQQAIQEICGIKTQCSTSGGTSDGRFIAPTGTHVVELGLINQTIHQINEHIELSDLTKLTHVYQRILELMFL